MVKGTVYLPKNEAVTDTEAAEIIDIDPDTLIGEAVAEFGGEPDENISVKIYKVNAEGKGTLDWCFNAVLSELPVSDRIRDKFGAGKFEIRVYSGAKIRRRLPFTIAEQIAQPERKNEDTNIMVGALEKLGLMVFKMNEQMQQRIDQLNPAPTAPVLDPIAMQQSMLTSMLQMRQLFAPETKPDQGGLAFDAFIKGVEIMKDVGGGSGGGAETGLWDVLKTMAQPDGLIGRLTDMAQAADNRLTTPPQLIGPDGKPIPTVQGATPPAVPMDNAERMKVLVKMKVAELLECAKRGADPGLYAELILDRVGPQAARDFIAAPDAMDKLIAINSDVTNHVEWFRAVGAHITDMLTENEPGSDGAVKSDLEGEDIAPSKSPERDTTRDT